jgi:transcription initiation factor TFIIIB Brf1 subunit/transcription initiation factor TFIIB
MTCPHDNISLPTSADPDTVCADCGAVLTDEEIRRLLLTPTTNSLS